MTGRLLSRFCWVKVMQKDFKTGIAVGLVLVTITLFWLCTRQNLSLKSRQNASSFPSNTESEQTKEENSEPYEQSEKIKNQRIHTVTKGETLSEISRKYYGTTTRWRDIQNANRNVIPDINKVKPGTELVIPN